MIIFMKFLPIQYLKEERWKQDDRAGEKQQRFPATTIRTWFYWWVSYLYYQMIIIQANNWLVWKSAWGWSCLRFWWDSNLLQEVWFE